MGYEAQKEQITGLLEGKDLPGSWDAALLYGAPTSMDQLVLLPHTSPTFQTQFMDIYLSLGCAWDVLVIFSPNTGYTKPCLASKVVQEQRHLCSIGSHMG